MKSGLKLASKFSILIFTPFLFAETSTVETVSKKIDVIDQKIDKVLDNQEKNLEIGDSQPLGNRKQGIEVNFFRLLYLGSDSKSLTGTYSMFDTKNNVEIAIPVFLGISDHTNYFRGSNQSDYSQITTDVHYRQYLGENLDGFYISAFARAAYLNGLIEGSGSYYNSEGRIVIDNNLENDSEYKIGLGVGVGYRIFSSSNLYWGMSLNIGRYMTGQNDRFYGVDNIDDDDDEDIFDIEFFKFGFAF